MSDKFFLNAQLCNNCGACCKRQPGCNFPSDFESEDEIVEALKSGRYAIDYWEGDPGDGDERTAYFVRPAVKGKEGILVDPAWGGKCTFLTNKGCELAPEQRPKQCLDLEPKKDLECKIHNGSTKQNASIAWRIHHDLLESLIDEVYNENS